MVTYTAAKAEGLSSEGHGLRQATIALGWTEAALFALAFFLSAATAAAARGEQGAELYVCGGGGMGGGGTKQ